MVKTTRTLLIVLAVGSPVLAGLSWAEQSPEAIAFHAADPVSHDGTREDDAGTAAEQVEEDDGEEDSRELPVGCPMVAHLHSAGPGWFFHAPSAPAALAPRGRQVRSRGPPTDR